MGGARVDDNVLHWTRRQCRPEDPEKALHNVLPSILPFQSQALQSTSEAPLGCPKAMGRLADCMLCGASSKEFAPQFHKTCPTMNTGCPCGKLKQLDGQIRDFLQQALKKRQELRSQVNHAHNRCFQQIPPEVVAYIFFFYLSPLEADLPKNKSNVYRASRHEVSGPLILGAVCQTWRKIAWSAPPLWNSMIIRLSTDKKSFPAKLAVAREWLGRSGQLPLSITLKCLGLVYDPSPMAHLLNEYASRWHFLKLKLIPPTFLSAFNINKPGLQGTSILHTINILVDSDWREQSGLPMFCAGTSQLSPKVVQVSGLLFPSIGIGWSSVTQVQATGFSVDECIELLRCAPLLTECKLFEVVSDQQRYPLPDSNIIHSGLNSLSLQPDQESVVDTFFCYLTLPSLLELTIGPGDGDLHFRLEFPTDTLTSFFARSSPFLKTLRLKEVFIDHETFVRILGTTPALTHLHIVPHYSMIYTPRHLFAHLAESWFAGDHTVKPFLPNLQSLHFSGFYSDPWDDITNSFGPISEITNPLRRPFNQLLFQWFDVDGDGHIDQENTMKLVALKGAGIDLQIIDSNSRAIDLTV